MSKHSKSARNAAKKMKNASNKSSNRVMGDTEKALSKVEGSSKFNKMKNKAKSLKDKASKKLKSIKNKTKDKFGKAKDKFKNSKFGKKSSKVAKKIGKLAGKFRKSKVGKFIGKVGSSAAGFMKENAGQVVGAFATGFASAAGSDIYNRVFGSDDNGGDNSGSGSGYGQGQQDALESGSDLADAAADSAIGSIGDKSPSGDLSAAIDDKKGQLGALNGEMADLDKLEEESESMSKTSSDLLKSYGIGSSGISNKPIKIKESGKKFSDYFGPKKMEGSDVAQAYGDSQGVDPQKIDRIIQLLEGNNELVANEAKIAGMPAKMKQSDIEGSMKATKSAISSLRSKESYEKSANAIVASGGDNAGGNDAGNSTASGGSSSGDGGGSGSEGGSTDSSDKDSGIGIGSALKYGALAYGAHATGLDSWVGGKVKDLANQATAPDMAKHKDNSGHYVQGGAGALDPNAATEVNPDAVKWSGFTTDAAKNQMQSGIASVVAKQETKTQHWYDHSLSGDLADENNAKKMEKELATHKFSTVNNNGTIEITDENTGKKYSMDKKDYDELKLNSNNTEISELNKQIDSYEKSYQKYRAGYNLDNVRKSGNFSKFIQAESEIPAYVSDYWNDRNNYYDLYMRKGKTGPDAYKHYYHNSIDNKLIKEYNKFLSEIEQLSNQGKLTDKSVKDIFLSHFKAYGGEIALNNDTQDRENANNSMKRGTKGRIYTSTADFDRIENADVRAKQAEDKKDEKRLIDLIVKAKKQSDAEEAAAAKGKDGKPVVNNEYIDQKKIVTQISNNIIKHMDEEREKK
jgi:hypothetical protein